MLVQGFMNPAEIQTTDLEKNEKCFIGLSQNFCINICYLLCTIHLEDIQVFISKSSNDKQEAMSAIDNI